MAERLSRTDGLDSAGDGHGSPIQSAARAVLCVAEAAELLGISRALTYDLIRRNEIPSVRLGRRILVPRIAIEQLLVQAAARTPT